MPERACGVCVTRRARADGLARNNLRKRSCLGSGRSQRGASTTRRIRSRRTLMSEAHQQSSSRCRCRNQPRQSTPSSSSRENLRCADGIASSSSGSTTESSRALIGCVAFAARRQASRVGSCILLVIVNRESTMQSSEASARNHGCCGMNSPGSSRSLVTHAPRKVQLHVSNSSHCSHAEVDARACAVGVLQGRACARARGVCESTAR